MRRILLEVLGTFLCLSMALCDARAEEKLAVFIPTVEHSKEIEKGLQKDPALSGIKVTAFANFEDFQTALKAQDFTYAIVPSYYPKYYTDLEPIYQFTVKDGKTFKYMVIALDASWTREKMGEGTAGIVNILGRDKTKTYSEELLSGKKFKRVKLVSKVQDLFPLLSLGNANYAVFEPKDLEVVLKDFNSKPFTVVETIEVGYPILAVKKGKTAAAKDNFKKLAPANLKELGVNGIVPYTTN